MVISELKEYIYKNKKIEYILESIGCHSISYHPIKEYYSCANYNGDNKNAINVKNNEHLNVMNWTRPNDFDSSSDIITLVQYNKNITLVDALKYLHQILDLPFEFKKEEKSKKKIDPLHIFKKCIKHRKGIVDVDDIHVLDDKLLDDFVPILHIDWLRDGIMPWTREKFGLAYSYRNKRVVIPMRYWLTGELLGFNQRTTVENYEEFGIKKYFITPTYPKYLNLYGLYENYESIQKAGYVVVAESEKSVLKRDSLGDGTVVALTGKTMSNEQVRILMGLNVEIVIALDKDVNRNEVRLMCDKFKNVRRVSYIWDSTDILQSKDAPMDASNKDYQFLFENRIVYDREEQRKLEESLKK